MNNEYHNLESGDLLSTKGSFPRAHMFVLTAGQFETYLYIAPAISNWKSAICEVHQCILAPGLRQEVWTKHE